MTARRLPLLAIVAVGVLAGCGGPAGEVSTGSPLLPPTTTSAPTMTVPDHDPRRLGHPGPPEQVLDATVVFFDADGSDARPDLAPLGAITDAGGLDAFAARYVHGSPDLGSSAVEALAQGKVLVGGTISQGCFPAERALLVTNGSEVHPVGVRPASDDPDVACARAITSTALLAIEPAKLPANTPVHGR